MTNDILIVFTILAISIILFATEKIRVDIIALLVIIALVLTGLVPFEEAFLGFAEPAVITVWAIYIVSAGLMRTGVSDYIGAQIMRYAGTTERRLIPGVMLAVGGMSAFMNNIGATAVLLPSVVTIGRRTKIAASKLLIPLAYGSLLGGTTTLIGTPPNFIASAELDKAGFTPFSFLDFTPIGLIIFIVGILYMLFIGRHILPDHSNSTDSLHFSKKYHLPTKLREITILQGSPLLGLTIAEMDLSRKYSMSVVGLMRNGVKRLGITPNAVVQVDDTLIVHADKDLSAFSEQLGIAVNDVTLDESDITDNNTHLAEIAVGQLAPFIGKKTRKANLRTQHGVNMLGIWRDGNPILTPLGIERFQLGDTILVQGKLNQLTALRDSISFILLDPTLPDPQRRDKARRAVIIFTLMIATVLITGMQIAFAALIAAVAMVLVGVLTMDEAYDAISWQAIFLIVGILPLSQAMQTTGAAQLLADQVFNLLGGFGARGVMLGIFALTAFLTAFMGNIAATLVVIPIALSTAVSQNWTPHALIMGIAIAASSSMITPIGHRACLLVYGPGNYKFSDFTKVGVPLMLIFWVIMVICLPIQFPF